LNFNSADGVLTLKNTDAYSPITQDVSITVVPVVGTVIPVELLLIEVSINREVILRFKIDFTDVSKHDPTKLHLILHEEFNLNPGTRYKYIPSYSQIGDLELENTRDGLHINSKLMNNDNKVFELNIATNEEPYKFEFFAPAILNGLAGGMSEVKIFLVPGQSLELKTVGVGFPAFSGFKIYEVGSSNEFKVEIDEREVGKGHLTNNSLAYVGGIGTADIRWEDSLRDFSLPEGSPQRLSPHAQRFLRRKRVSVKVTDSLLGNLDLGMSWKITEHVEEEGLVSIHAYGFHPNLGSWHLSRDVDWKNTRYDTITIKVLGFEDFSMMDGPVIETDYAFDWTGYWDLKGKLMKKVNDQEYSLEFFERSYLPKIVMDQKQVLSLVAKLLSPPQVVRVSG